MQVERELDTILDEVCADIHRDMTSAFEAAQRDGKKLIILLGESHEFGFSLLLEVMFVLFAHQLGIKNVCVELDQQTYQVMQENNGWTKRTAQTPMFLPIPLSSGGADKLWISSTPIFQLTRELKMNMVPVDSTLSERAYTTTADNLSKSNKVMSEAINQLNDHALHIVGLMHLPGMLRDYPLDPQKYHVITYNICSNHQIVKDSIVSTEKRLRNNNHFFMSKEQSEWSLPLLRYIDCAKNIIHLTDRLEQAGLRSVSRKKILKLGLQTVTRYYEEMSKAEARPK